MSIKTKHRLIGNLAHYLIKGLYKTLKLNINYHEKFEIDKPYLFCFWHGKQFMPVMDLKNHKTKNAALVSPSKDGDMLEVWLRNLGYDVIRGSSRKNNIAALKSMMKFLKNNYSVGFGIDGPIGPIYKVKPGMTHMSQKLGIPIVPIGSYFSKKWVLEKAWDKYEIPRPFASASIYYGEPIFIDKNVNLEESNIYLESKIVEAERKARNLL